MKGLTVYIYKNPAFQHCSNGGISETHDRALLIGPGIPEIFEAGDLPVLELKKGNARGIVKITPYTPAGAREPWWMFGGAYVCCSDNRVSDAVEAMTGAIFYGAIALHDRQEV